jgi:S1-C subfamily serine protease
MLALILFALLSLEDKVQSTAVHLISETTECSGTVIDPTHILTAKHCVGATFDKAEIGGPDLPCYGLGKVTTSKTQDLALIEFKYCGTPPVAQIADAPISRGEAFTIVGLSYDVSWALARGFVMSAIPQSIQEGKDKPVFKDIPLFCQGCDEGDSGSGVFNNQGELAGVFVAASQNNVRAYMVPLDVVKKFLHGS